MADEAGYSGRGMQGGERCIANIGHTDRRKRLTGGAVTLGAGVVILSGLLAMGTGRWWRLVLFPLFFGGAQGVFQWREKT